MRVQLKKIISASDFSENSNLAVTYGQLLAKEFSAKLFLCHVLSVPFGYGEALPDPFIHQSRLMDQASEQFSRWMENQSVEWEPVVSVGLAAEEITRIAEEKKVDLAICATHGRSGLKRLLLGSVTERLMRSLSCPVLVVRPKGRDISVSPADHVRFQRILVGCDFSPDSDLAFQYALGLAQEYLSELHIVHVIEPPLYKHMLQSTKMEEMEPSREGLRSTLKEKLMGMIPQDAQNWCKPVTVLLAGQPYDELTKYAVVNEMDLVVLGLRGRSLMETLLMGSTTDRVIRQAPCPVLSVRPVSWNREDQRSEVRDQRSEK
jgi:nucleotide-binding universal stress UspA family protein